MAEYYVDENGNVTRSKKKKQQKKEPSYYVDIKGNVIKAEEGIDDIAPVKEQTEERSWFRRSEYFDDGYDFGDITKSIYSSGKDLMQNIGAGAMEIIEKGIDAAATIAPAYSYSQQMQNLNPFNYENEIIMAQEMQEESQEKMSEFVKKDLYDSEAIIKDIFGDGDEGSVFGEKTDSLAQSGGQLLATMGANVIAPGSGIALNGILAFGAEAESAFNSGASYEEAVLSATITAGAEVLTEQLSGGISFGGRTLDEGLTALLSNGISNKVVRTLAKWGIDTAGEGFEEIVSGVLSDVGKKITYDKDNDVSFADLAPWEWTDEQWEEFIGGAVLGGVSSGTQIVKDTIQGKDSVTGLNKTEQTVLDKVIEQRTAEAEKDGAKLNLRERAKIREKAMSDLEKGRISVATIEEALGGETYESYKSASESKKALMEEYTELGKTKTPTLAEQTRYAELTEKVRSASRYAIDEQLKTKLSEEVRNKAKGTKLEESYREVARRSQKFDYDNSTVDTKYRATYERAKAAGVLNNTYRSHQLVEIVARLEADKGITFDFSNNERIKESGMGVEGKIVDGFVTKDGKITINVNSPKAWQTTVGHEITHVLEGTEHYGELKSILEAYVESKSKGEIERRRADISRRYKTADEAKIDSELVADLVGEYIFSDEAFIKHLGENRNIFQKIYDEIKYIYKIATAESQEAKDIERIKREFDKVYKELGKVNRAKSAEIAKSAVENNADNAEGVATPSSEVRYSLREEAPPKKTQEVYKLMRLQDDGKLYPLFIDSAEGIEVGKWYNADSPDMAILKTMPSGVFLVDPSGNTYQSLDEYLRESGERKTKFPSKKAIEQAATEGKRWVYIEETARGQRRYNGETRKYWNLGINGSGSVSTFAMRPGWHAGSLPTMRQIGKGTNRDLRDDTFVWTVGEVPADIDYQAEADQNPDKDIPYHIPKDGFYLKATNADKAKSQADTVGWYVAGAFKANRVISDSEARQIIDEWNASHPDAIVEYDYDRESGMDFDAEQMKLVPRERAKHSLSDDFAQDLKSAKLYLYDGDEYYTKSKELYAKYQDGTANKENFFVRTIAEFKRVARRPSRKPDYVSRGRGGFISSEYWYTEEGVIRGSSHWGLDIASCDWKLEGVPLRKEGVTRTSKLYGYASWDSFVHKASLVTAPNGERFVSTFNNTLDKHAYVYNEEQFEIANYGYGAEYHPYTKYSLSEDITGKKLTQEQIEYFKDSKVVDEEGKLKVMYHGSTNAGFHTFNGLHSDDGMSFFFTDSPSIAQSYSGSSEVYEARTFRTADELNSFFAEVGEDELSVVEENGKFTLLDDGEVIIDSDSASGIFEQFRNYTGLGRGSGNYAVYLNITNPLVVDAQGRNWNNISREFSQDVYDRYMTLTAEEKAALQSLAEWEDISIFRDELIEAAYSVENGSPSIFTEDYTKTLASAYKKLGGADVDMYRLFDIASDNFTEDSLRANATVKLKTRDYAQRAKDGGYDGVIFKNIVDVGGFGSGAESSTVAIAFESNQIKSVANNAPTSDADIRYSLSEGKVTAEEDAAYMDAYFDGDDGAMQELVDKVANRLGYKYKAYHHTENAFTVFNLSKARKSMDIQGFYFSADMYDSSEYGSVRYDTYLRMDNPYIVDSKEAQNAIPFDMSKDNAGVIAREWLQSQGYDGVIRKAEYFGGEADEYIVFDSSQIKSAEPMTFADDEFGEGDVVPLSERFNPENKDIRYSLTEQEVTKANETLKSTGLEYDAQSETVSYSLSSLEDAFSYNDPSGFIRAREEYINALKKTTGKTREECERYLNSLFLVHDMIANDRARLDYDAAVGKSAWVSNAEYGGSIDFSTLCAKRRLFTGTFDAIQQALPDTILTSADFLTIRNMLLEGDLESPCSMCYVEGSRAKHGEYVAKWLKSYLATNPEWRPQIADFTSTTLLEQTRINHPEAYEAYIKAMNKLAQRKPKEASVRTDYKGEILVDFADGASVEIKNNNGGVRFNSFSDFEVIHALDCMQVITDMARVGLNGQAYTKVKEFAECFGNTGLKINLSLVAKGVDANGRLIMDETNGMKYSEAMDLRNRYSDNVGTVIVVFNNEQLKAALADNTIDYVLPFHRSQWKASQYAAMGLPASTADYTVHQNDRMTNPKTGKLIKVPSGNLMPNTYWDSNLSGRENAQVYLDYINENGYTPKFPFVLDKVDGKWVLPEGAIGDGYFKLLIDFKMYNNDGVGAPQSPVLPEFNMPYIQEMLEDYKGSHSSFPVAHDIVSKFVEGKKSAKYSISGPDIAPTEGTPLNELALEEAPTAEGEDDIAPIGDGVATAPNDTERKTLANEYERKKAEIEAEYADRDAFISKSARDLYNEIISLKKGVRASGDLSSILDFAEQFNTDADPNAKWRKARTALLNVAHSPSNTVDANSQTEAIVREMLDKKFGQKEYLLAALESGYKSDLAKLEGLASTGSQAAIKKRLESILAVETELENNIKHREQARADYEAEIADLQAEYEGKKNKTTKIANDILRRIDNRRRRQSEVDAAYAKRISDLEARLEKMRTPEYSRALQRKAKWDEYDALIEKLVGDTSSWKDKKLGIGYQTGTLRRNLRYTVRDAKGNPDYAHADAIYDETQGKYNEHEAELHREETRIKKVFADMKITNAESEYIQMLGEFRHNPDTEITAEEVEAFFEKHKKHIDPDKVNKAIELARETYDSLLKRVNERLREQGMREIPYRKGYFPNFTVDKQGILAKLLNWKTQNNEIPTSIAGITETFEPNRTYQSFDKQRKDGITDYNFLKGLDSYVHGALDWIYHIEDIQKRRALENYIRYSHSEGGIKDKIDAIRANEEYDADEMQRQIDLVYKEAKNPLNNFVTDLHTGTNILAGKKSTLDRGIEAATNRHIYSVMTNISNRYSANTVVGSISAALTNFIPITQSWLQVSPLRSAQAIGYTIRNAVVDDGMIEKSTFLTNRLRQAEKLDMTAWDKIGDGATFLMDAVDSFTSQVVWRSKYLDNMSKGMSEAEAIKDADQFAENVIAGRSRGNMPTLFHSKNPITKLFTVFQLEVNNQYGYMFEDAPQDMKNEGKLKLIKGYATMFIGAYVYNALYSAISGRDAAFDPVSIIQEFIGDLFDDDEEDEFPVDAFTGLAENLLQNVPFVGSWLGGGRFPISSVLPYDGGMDMLEGTLTDIKEENWGNITKEWLLNPAAYFVLPMGGGQIRKTIDGLSMFNTDEEHPIAGSYTTNGDLRYPVEDTFINRVQAGIFGRWANKNAQDYINQGRAPLNEKQTKEFIDVGMTIQEYWKYRDGLKGLKTNGEKVAYIHSLDLTDEQKNILVNNILERKEDVDISDFGDYSSLEEFDFANKYPSKYQIAQAIGGYGKYVSYKGAINDIESDKDEWGKAITGSRKNKVIAYINSLDIERGEKLILFKNEYKGDDSYNQEIISYLDSRDDITYDEQVTILEELGFIVYDDGTVRWD